MKEYLEKCLSLPEIMYQNYAETLKSYEDLCKLFDSNGMCPMKDIIEHIKQKESNDTSFNSVNLMKWKASFITYITVGLYDYLSFVDRRNTMSDTTIKSTANLILDEFNTLTIYDIPLFIRMCKLSRFGELKDLNGSVILRWLSQYIKERDAVRNNHIHDMIVTEQRQKVNDCDETVVDSEKIDEIFSRLMSKFDNKNATT